MFARAIVAVAMALLLTRCATTKDSTLPETSASPLVQNADSLNEDFDPLSLHETEFKIPSKNLSGEKEVQPVVEASEADTSLVEVTGYQVQILQTEDAALARATVRDAAVVLATAVALTFDSPYFKVRAGNFVNRFEAEQLQELAAAKGYASAWVVRTKVKVRMTELEPQ